MFRSRVKPIVIPQAEHLRIVGTLALLWGNADFEPPPVERGSLVAGMGLHDRGYGPLDNSPIGEMAAGEWEKIARAGFYGEYRDAVADLIAKYHVRRLASHGSSPERKALAEEFGHAIAEKLDGLGMSPKLFERLDRVTNLCDMVSFDFCFGEPAAGSASVFPRNGEEKEVEVGYRIDGEKITLAPWPLSVEVHESYIIAYLAEGYPDRLDPVILPYRLART